MSIPIIIPAYQPDKRMIDILKKLQRAHLQPVVVVDDGSGPQYRHFFEEAEMRFDCTVLRHAVNQGKGRALKTAFNYCLNEYSDLIGCVTADSDGQHTPECISKCRDALIESPDSLILGCRDFDLENVPTKSRMGNKISCKVCAWFCGVKVSDTQTGLRAIPKAFMQELMNVAGERFEFETNMLIQTKERIKIREVEIETVYDSKENHATHFNPLRDSIRIYKLFLKSFFKFIFSSLSSSVIDLSLFSLLCALLTKTGSGAYVIWATILARLISATYNYLLNYKFVFKGTATHGTSVLRYIALATAQMLVSAVCVFAIVQGMKLTSYEIYIKIVVDVILFMISFVLQREFVYNKKRGA